MFVRAVLAFLFIAFVAGPARADLYSAQLAYHKGEFETAYRKYRDLAKLGQPLAQFNLAVLYARGEGVELSNTFSYAWATLAADNGHPKAPALVEELRPLLTPGSLKIAEEIRQEFGSVALDERLMPKLSDGVAGTREGCRLEKEAARVYPERARRRGVQGDVYVEFVVMPDGRARHPRIMLAVPPNEFEDSVRRFLRRSTFIPGRVNGKVVPCSTGLYARFMLTGAGEYVRLDKFIRETKAKAEAGDAVAQTLYGVLIAGLPQLERPRSEALPWFLKAAQAGQSFAQFQIGSRLMRCCGCELDETKGLTWLRKAAEVDQPDAQVSLAIYALRAQQSDANLARAKLWLERAVQQDHRDAKIYLAALLAAAPSEDMRDSSRSLELLEQVFQKVDDDPTSFEIRAAARAAAGNVPAAAGNFPAAVKDQERAIDMARELGWDLAPQQVRLERYRENQPWYGDLLGMAETVEAF